MVDDKCVFQRRNLSRKKKDKNKLVGISIFNIQAKNKDNPKGYCGSIGVSGNHVEIYTNGKYRFIPKKKALLLFKKILKHEEERASSHS